METASAPFIEHTQRVSNLPVRRRLTVKAVLVPRLGRLPALGAVFQIAINHVPKLGLGLLPRIAYETNQMVGPFPFTSVLPQLIIVDAADSISLVVIGVVLGTKAPQMP